MMDLESKLREYRAKRNKEAQINHFKNKLKSYFHWKRKEYQSHSDDSEHADGKKEATENLLNSTLEEVHVNENVKHSPHNSQWFRYGFYVASSLAWILLYYICIQVQFGTVFLIVSALAAIYFNTRTGPKDPTEISAYSVFNKNCESIDGTLKAEQFEREIRYGAQSVHS